jgi:hypothetical protein
LHELTRIELAKIGEMDSLAPARSALRPSVSPNSFRRFPNGSSRVKQSSLIFLHFARKTFNPWAGLKTDSRSGAQDGPCRTGHWVVGELSIYNYPAALQPDRPD